MVKNQKLLSLILEPYRGKFLRYQWWFEIHKSSLFYFWPQRSRLTSKFKIHLTIKLAIWLNILWHSGIRVASRVIILASEVNLTLEVKVNLIKQFAFDYSAWQKFGEHIFLRDSWDIFQTYTKFLNLVLSSVWDIVTDRVIVEIRS